MHSPELMLLLHNVDQAELYNELRGRARGARPGLARRAWTAVSRAVARAESPRRSPSPAVASACVGPCVA